jgi:hypothetical protein
MNGFRIELEVSLRDTQKFTDFLRDTRIENVFDFTLEQPYSNSWVLSSDKNIEDYEVQDLINELEEICEGFEIDFVAEC